MNTNNLLYLYLFHTFGVVIVSGGHRFLHSDRHLRCEMVFIYINPHHPEGIDEVVIPYHPEGIDEVVYINPRHPEGIDEVVIPHHPEGIDRYVENDAPTLISMPKVWNLLHSFHTFGVVIVLWGIVFYIAIDTFGVRWYLYIYPHHPEGIDEVVNPHHPEGIDRYVENDAPTLISMPKVWNLLYLFHISLI